MKEVNKFVIFGKDDYKDIKQFYKKINKIGKLEQNVKKLPASKVLENLNGYEALLKLDPTNQLYKKKVAHYQAKYEEKRRMDEEKERLKALSDLELISWSWSEEHGYVTAEGQVKNISGQKLKSVEALVTWYDSNGTMITYDSSLIEYNPIMPGQTSPFKVMEQYNPAMKKAGIEFKFMWGSMIPFYKK